MVNRKVLIRLVVIAGGVGILLLSLFAYQLGLDNDPGWGPRRFQILGAGLVLILFGALYWITPIFSRWFGPSSKYTSQDVTLSQESKPLTNARSNHTDFWLLLIVGLALLSYVWIISIGTMNKWPSGRDYFWMLAQAFQKGQTSLLVEPSPALLKLENPYDLSQRKSLDYLWDTTLYHGKYYLYWGPVPAVLAILINLITKQPVSDAWLVFLFVTGTVLFSVLLLRKLFQDDRLPGWVFWGGVLACAVNIPLIWLFTHPAYYEASIAGGQFFMMAGFFLLYLAFRSPKVHTGYVFFSALAFGLAGGTRISLLPSVIFLAFMILLRVYLAHQRNLRASGPAFAAALIPLAIIGLSLTAYNYDRFGSIFEFGHRYQLTGLASTADYSDQTSLSYVIPSTYSYFFRPPSLSEQFPFITVPAIKEKMWPFFINPPENYYYAEPLAGLLLVVPLIGFTAILLLRVFWLLINGDVFITNIRYRDNEVLIWFGAAMLGYILIQTAVLLVFVSTSMRYLVDITPALIVLSSIFVGLYTQSFGEKGYWVKVILFLWLFTASLTVLAGLLIGLTGGQNNFLNKNPQLYHQLLEWFSR
jgi:hypothetical protein